MRSFLKLLATIILVWSCNYILSEAQSEARGTSQLKIVQREIPKIITSVTATPSPQSVAVSDSIPCLIITNAARG